MTAGYKRTADKRLTVWTGRHGPKRTLLEVHRSNKKGDSVALELDEREKALLNAFIQSVTERNREARDVI